MIFVFIVVFYNSLGDKVKGLTKSLGYIIIEYLINLVLEIYIEGYNYLIKVVGIIGYLWGERV